MRNIVNTVLDKKKVILEVLLLPIAIYIANTLALAIFNAGTILGTFLRYIHYYVVC